jgi:hypothetical protein
LIDTAAHLLPQGHPIFGADLPSAHNFSRETVAIFEESRNGRIRTLHIVRISFEMMPSKFEGTISPAQKIISISMASHSALVPDEPEHFAGMPS